MKNMIKKSLILMFLVAVVFIGNPAVPITNNYDSTTNISNISLQLDTVASGTLTSGNTQVAYDFAISVSGAYSFNLSAVTTYPNTISYTVFLIKTNGSILANQQMPQTIMVNAGSYEIDIGGVGNYTIAVDHAPAGVLRGNAISLPLNTPYLGSMPSWYWYTDMWFNFSVPQSGTYNFADFVPNYNNYFNMYLYNYTLGNNPYYLIVNNQYQDSIDHNLDPGQYSMLLQKVSGDYGPFNTSVNYIPSLTYYSLTNSKQLSVNSTVNNNITLDFLYNTTITTNGTYTFSLVANQTTTNYWLYLFNNRGVKVSSVTTGTYPEQLVVNLSVGVYVVQIFDVIGSGNFSLTFMSGSQTTTPPTSTTTSTSGTPGTSGSTTVISNNISNPSNTVSSSNAGNSSSNSKKNTSSPFGSLYIIILSFFLFSFATLISRRRK